jgi:hypothetical protein
MTLGHVVLLRCDPLNVRAVSLKFWKDSCVHIQTPSLMEGQQH